MNSSNSKSINIVPTPKKTFTMKETMIQQGNNGLCALRGEPLSTCGIADE